MAKAPQPPLMVGDSSSPVPPPPPLDPAGSDSDSDSDSNNYSLDELQFVIHAVDDDRRRRPAPAPLLPIQNRLPIAEEQADLLREAARLERLRYFLILPQGILWGCVLVFGILMICLANTAVAQANLVWVFVCSALIIFFSLVSMLLSYLAVYHYDSWPWLNGWLR